MLGSTTPHPPSPGRRWADWPRGPVLDPPGTPAGGARCPSRPCSRPRGPMWAWKSARRDARPRCSNRGTCHAVSRPSRVRGRVNTSGWRPKPHRAGRSSAGGGQVLRELGSCTSPKAAPSRTARKFQPSLSKMNRLSYLRSSSISRRERAPPPPRAEELHLRAPAPAPQQEGPARPGRGRRGTPCRLQPAAVMMWERAKLVTEMSDREPVGVPRSAEPSSRESCNDRRCRARRPAPAARPSRALPMRSGTSIASCGA